MPSKISAFREVAYLRALAETGNATLAAERAGVSLNWAYKKREADARFDALVREMAARFRESPAEPSLPTLSREGRGDKRTRVNRERKGGWTVEKEARFLERLQQTCSVPLAAAEVGLSAGSAYQRRKRRPGFAAAWDEALLSGWPPADCPWIESANCFLEGEGPPRANHVRITGVAEVIERMWGWRAGPRRPRSLPK